MPVAQFAADSSFAVTNQATAPGAGAVIATTTPTVPGRYSIQINAGLGNGGVPAATENANMRLVVDGTTITALPIVGAQNVIVGCGTFILTLSGGQAVQVQAIGAGTASVVYIAQIVPTLLNRTDQ